MVGFVDVSRIIETPRQIKGCFVDERDPSKHLRDLLRALQRVVFPSNLRREGKHLVRHPKFRFLELDFRDPLSRGAHENVEEVLYNLELHIRP